MSVPEPLRPQAKHPRRQEGEPQAGQEPRLECFVNRRSLGLKTLYFLNETDIILDANYLVPHSHSNPDTITAVTPSLHPRSVTQSFPFVRVDVDWLADSRCIPLYACSLQ